MNKGQLVNFSVGEQITEKLLKKELGNDFQSAVENEYFVFYGIKDQEKIYVFTEKGKRFAWSE